MKLKFCLPAIAILLFGCASRPPLETVPQVDLERYSGKWYEVARYPNWFQKNCAGNITAEYTLEPDGRVKVVNSCSRQDGTIAKVHGYANTVNKSGNAKLKVGFGFPIKGDYWIIGLDPKYRWALVGHPSRKYLWILSRTPEMAPETYRKVVDLAAKKGYETSKIISTIQ